MYVCVPAQCVQPSAGGRVCINPDSEYSIGAPSCSPFQDTRTKTHWHASVTSAQSSAQQHELLGGQQTHTDMAHNPVCKGKQCCRGCFGGSLQLQRGAFAVAGGVIAVAGGCCSRRSGPCLAVALMLAEQVMDTGRFDI